jgi:protein-disulfide isomerase
VPVAIFGALYFAAVLAIAALAWRPAIKAPSYAPAYIFALSLPALAFVAYLAFASFFILHAFCILCVTTYVAVVGITLVSWRASRVPFGTVPGRASKDLVAAAGNPVALAVAAVLIVATVVTAKAFPSGNAPAGSAPVPVEALPVVADADRAKLAEWWEVQPKEDLPVDGGGARVVVVKFNDYQCPLCGVTFNMYRPLFDKHGDSVKLVTKHYPLEGECNPGVPGGSHLAACEAAAAVIMAEAKGTARQMEEWLFANQQTLTPAKVKQAARDVAGITDFDAQYPAALKRIRADAELGERLKVNATPTFFINGRRLPEALAAQYMNVLIEIELNR